MKFRVSWFNNYIIIITITIIIIIIIESIRITDGV